MSEYEGKWKDWIHAVSNGRCIVAEKRGDYWFSKNSVDDPGEHEIRGHNPLDLVAKGVRTYASRESAVRAFKRVYGVKP